MIASNSTAGLVRIAALVCLVAGSGTASAQPSKAELTEGNPALAKVSSRLLRVRALAADDRSATEVAASVPLLEMRDGQPVVEVRLDRLTPSLLDELRRRGLEVASFHLGYGRAYGRLDPANLDELAALAEVVIIQPMPRRGTRIGSASNQAEATMNVDDARALGYDGTGVEVGVLSDSFNDVSPGMVAGAGCNRTVTDTSSQTSGDLPVSVVSLEDGPGGGIDEGRAIAELMYDLVPGATFSFHSAFNSPADFAGGITELRGCGAHLIVDAVFWTGQAFFQDDIIAQAAQGAVAAGTPYVSAAGNDATFGVQDTFLDSDPMVSMAFPPSGVDFHDFGGGDHHAQIRIPAGCNLYAELQWAEPFDSLSAPGLAAASDLDLYLVSDMTVPLDLGESGNVLDFSVGPTGCGNAGPPSGDPVESVAYLNTTGSTETVYLVIDHWCGDPTVPFRIVTISFDCNTTLPPWEFEDGETGETDIFAGPQIFGHPAAKDVIAVGAAFYEEIDSGGTVVPPSGQLDVEAFSSLGGGIPFYFDGSGNPLPLAPELRFKPDVTGPDGTDTTFFGNDTGDLGSDPNFFGTSAAAPNSAAIAALILEATDLKINPLPLEQLLSHSTIDMEVPGLDNLSGSGFTDALRALRSLDPSMTPLVPHLAFDLDGGHFFSSPPATLQRLQALDTLVLGNGNFDGLDGVANSLIFTDGFESGDVSAWSNTTP